MKERVVSMLLQYKLITIITLTLLTFHSHAATNKVGNGGNIIFCQNNPSQSQLLDFYEHLEPSDLNKEQSNLEADAFELAKQNIEKLSSIAPRLSRQYLNRLEQIEKEILWVENKLLQIVNDSFHPFIPKYESGCEVVQTALRRANAHLYEQKFIIRKDIWDKIPQIHRAGLLTHEIIYEHFSKLGETNSLKARQLNALLFTDNEKLHKRFWPMIQEFRLPIYP